MYDSPLVRKRPSASRYRRKARHIILPTLVCFASVLAVCAAVADEVPRLDVTPSCRAGESVAAVPNAFAACMQKEEQARDQLKANWAQFTQADKTRCIQTCKCGDLTPSYVELLTCLEMANDVRKLHKGDGPTQITSPKKK